jgi:hypothetical protein
MPVTPNAMMMKRKIVFIHMPKCAGTSLRRAIETAFLPEADGPGPAVRIETVPTATAARISGMDIQDFREQVLLYYMSDPGIHFISGHVSFSETAYRHYSKEWDFITLLRHPVSRWLSHYYFNRYKENSHTKITSKLEDFIHSERGRQFGSEYVRRLSQGVEPAERNGQAAIDKARENLSRISMVGTLEQLDDFCGQVEERFGVRIQPKRLNTNPAPDRLQQTLRDKRVINMIEALCQPDLEIYEAARRRADGGR